MTDIQQPQALPDTFLLAPDGTQFVWGPIQHIHAVGPYQIVEYLRDMSRSSQREYWHEHGKSRFHPYIDRQDTHISYLSLDSALVGAVAYRREGPNGAASYFDLMTGAS